MDSEISVICYRPPFVTACKSRHTSHHFQMPATTRKNIILEQRLQITADPSTIKSLFAVITRKEAERKVREQKEKQRAKNLVDEGQDQWALGSPLRDVVAKKEQVDTVCSPTL